jgi:6-phosphogluconolactonase
MAIHGVNSLGISNMQRFYYPSAEILSQQLASNISAQLRASIAMRGRADVAFAGGKTPLPIYAKLSAELQGVHAIATDERWVPAGHALHNLTALKQAAPNFQWHALTPDELSVSSSEPNTSNAEHSLQQFPDAFDLVLLGMGLDGHFASLFPGDAQLPHALSPNGAALAYAIKPNPLPAEAPVPRISLSISRLIRARRIVLLITGEAKLAILNNTARALPIHALMTLSLPQLELHWSP